MHCEETMNFKTALRTHTCGELGVADIGKQVTLCGWIDTVRDHGGIVFVDLRDRYGVTQIVVDPDMVTRLQKESSVSFSGVVEERAPETVNARIATGKIEVRAAAMEVLGTVYNMLPFEPSDSLNIKEETRLKYRFLDLRNPKMAERIKLRADLIAFLRKKMEEHGFTDVQTPILTASSPEGARDFLVPSRKHKGKFYALPQAPQMFKQLLMVAGIDRYYQIAPCFRDEDARADRSPGEFYQLDFEMSYATQEDVFAVAEDVLSDTFGKFSSAVVDRPPFVRIPYREAMLRYGTDKPDLRNPLFILDLSDLFARCDFAPFKGAVVRAVRLPGGAAKSKKFFEDMLKFATEIGMKGLGYVKCSASMALACPIAKFSPVAEKQEFIALTQIQPGDVVFFISDKKGVVDKLAGQIRTELAVRCDLIEKNAFRFCFIVDFPMYEIDEETGDLKFMHNPFSMPQGGADAFDKDPLEILAYQYDIVVNGVELSSGAVRNHRVDIMTKAFALAGYSEEDVKQKFGALYNAFHYGAPPHAGMAPGVDRMLMLLAGTDSIRDVIAFPLNGNAEDLLLGAPNFVTEQQLREVHVKLR